MNEENFICCVSPNLLHKFMNHKQTIVIHQLKSILRRVFLLVLIFLSLTSCKKEEEKKYVFGFSQGLWNHPFRERMNEELQIAASLYPNLDIDIKISPDDELKQSNDIQSFIDNKVDLILICPRFTNSLNEVIDRANKAGIPIITIERKVNNSSVNSFIGADNIDVGVTAAKRILSSSNRPLNVVEIYVDEDSSPASERSYGFRTELKKSEYINLKSFKDKDVNEFREYLIDNKNKIDYLFAFSDKVALQFWKIAKQIDYENKIKFIGVDGLNVVDGGIPLVIDGTFDASVYYPTGSMEAVKYGMELVNGNAISSFIKQNTTLIDKTNADILKNQFEKISSLNQIIEDQIRTNNNYIKRNLFQRDILTLSMFLLILLIISIVSIYRLYLNKRDSNNTLKEQNEEIINQRNQLEKNEKEIKQVTEQKMNFFTGLSHEFKTPITLINSSVETLFEMNNQENKNELSLIYNNTNRLHRLINQLLDFRKLEDRQFKLQASKVNLIEFTKRIIADFKSESKKKGVEIALNYNEEVEVYLDENLMDKVYFNLISNALKFSEYGGEIQISIQQLMNPKRVKITVKDNGIGIPKDEQSELFKPFFKGSNNRKSSSGIGLFISKQFVELHNGEISIESNPKGTQIQIILPLGKKHLNKDQIIGSKSILKKSVIDFESDDHMTLIEKTNSKFDSETDSILIIEDNIDLLNFLSNKFRSRFNTLTSTGSDAIELALESIPDIIICDINLSDKSGFEITKELKSDIRTSHIPIIILTALSDSESYISALKAGADMYLTKPFSFSVLSQSIRSILFNRDKLKEFYVSNMHKIENLHSLNGNDQQFIKKLNLTINEFISSKIESLSIDEIASKLGVSRIQLYRKVKALIGVNIGDYLNDLVLENAKLMIETTDMTISEIAYANGFSSPNYFSTAFKNKYKSTPLSYRKSFKL